MALKLALVGATGRAGKEVLKVLPEFPQFRLVAAVHSGKSSALGGDLPYTTDLESAVGQADCVLEFSSAALSVDVAKICAQYGRTLVLASSGHTPQQLDEIRRYSSAAPFLHASNLSLGVFVLHEISKQTQKLLGPDYQIEIFEMHHRHKKDAPSGTALSLERELVAAGDLTPVHDRAGRAGPRKESEIGLSSARGGEVLGEHTIYFLGNGDRLELTHRTADRAVFARGGLKALEKLHGRSARLYSLREVFGFDNS